MSRVIVALALVVVWTGRSWAQTPEEREAFRLYQEAQGDIEASRYAEALEKLDRAYKMFQMPHILVRKAEALRGLGELGEALDLLRSIQVSDKKLKIRVADLIVAITRELQEPVAVEVQTNVPDVEVVVDQTEKYLAPCVVRVTPGRHQFEFRKSGYETITLERNIAGPDTRTVRVALRGQTGRVVFATDLPSFEGVVIRLDDREMVPKGRAGAANRTDVMEVQAGVHDLLCAREGTTPFMRRFEVPADRTVEVVCLLKPPASGPSRRTWAWVTLGTGAAMAAAGVGLVTWYYVKRGQDPGTDAAGNRYVFRDRHENIVGFALLGVGVATAAASYFLFTSDDGAARGAPPDGASRFFFSISPASGGAVAAGAMSF